MALAQSLVLEPDVLLLDEPFAHLDFQTKLALEAELLQLIRDARARQARPVTTILVTHDIAEAVVLADRIVAVGGYPASPTKIVREIPIVVEDAQRDPIRMREGTALPAYFQETWRAIRGDDSVGVR